LYLKGTAIYAEFFAPTIGKGILCAKIMNSPKFIVTCRFKEDEWKLIIAAMS
jgi:hypothetical protein